MIEYLRSITDELEALKKIDPKLFKLLEYATASAIVGRLTNNNSSPLPVFLRFFASVGVPPQVRSQPTAVGGVRAVAKAALAVTNSQQNAGLHD